MLNSKVLPTNRVVILGVWRLSSDPNKRAGGQSCPLHLVRTGHIGHIEHIL